MKRVSTYSLALALAFGASTMIATQPAAAMQEAEQASFDASQLSDAVREQAGTAQQILNGEAPDLASAEQVLTGAEAAVSNNHDRYFVGTLLLQLSVAMQNSAAADEAIIPIQRRGLQLAVDSGLLAPDQHARYLRFLGGMAETPEQALNAFRSAAEANPNDAEVQIQLARALFNAGETAAGYEAAERAIELAARNGVAFDQTWFGVPLNAAYNARDVNQALRFGHLWVENQPSEQSWREALRIYQYAGRLGDQANLDALRLMRTTGSLDADGYDEYIELATRRGYFGEALAAYDEGTSSGGLTADAARRAEIAGRIDEDRSSLDSVASDARGAATGEPAMNTADAYVGYGNYDPAIALYRTALEKGGVDAGTVNLRLGRALYEAGRMDGAREAFAAVTGNRAGLARFWQIWLDQQAGGAAAPEAAPEAEAEAETTAE